MLDYDEHCYVCGGSGEVCDGCRCPYESCECEEEVFDGMGDEPWPLGVHERCGEEAYDDDE